jgi:hypothetical protein
MIGHDIGSSTTSLWIDTTNPSMTPVATSTSSTTSNIRRVNLRMYNSDGSPETTTNLGVFYMDNLTVTTIPEPSTYAALLGLLTMGLVLRRRMRG